MLKYIKFEYERKEVAAARQNGKKVQGEPLKTPSGELTPPTMLFKRSEKKIKKYYAGEPEDGA